MRIRQEYTFLVHAESTGLREESVPSFRAMGLRCTCKSLLQEALRLYPLPMRSEARNDTSEPSMKSLAD